jgi:hypothetical protein
LSIANLRLVPDVQISALHKYPEGLDVFVFGGDEDDETVTHAPSQELDLGETWPELDQLLGERAFIGSGGRLIGEVGKGPARSFTAAEVAALSKHLNALSDGDVKKRAKRASAGVLESFAQLKAFVAAAAVKQLGMVAYLA